MQSITESSIAALLKNKTVYVVRPERHDLPEKSHRRDATDEVTRTPKGRKRAAQMFHHELRMRFKMRFSSSFEGAARQTSERLPYRETASPTGVATDVLQTARQIADTESGNRQETVAALRETVQEAGSAGLAAAETGEERTAVRDTADLVYRGLDQIDEQPAINRYESLDVEAKSKQRTSIKIRTQEGDVVRFDLRQVDKLSLSDVSESDGTSSSQETNISVSSKSRLMLKVRGDLNEAELEAIRSVFATAESLADEFFAGDMSAALEIAAGLEFDSEQLARVSMRFRSIEQVRATQVSRSTGEVPQLDDVDVQPDPITANRPDVNEGVGSAARGESISAVPSVEPVVTGPVSEVSEQQPPVTDAVVNGADTPQDGFGSLLEFLGKLADYLEETAARFRTSFESSFDSQQVRFELTQSLQLEILRTVMTVKAPEQSVEETEQSGEVIRQLDLVGESTVASDD